MDKLDKNGAIGGKAEAQSDFDEVAAAALALIEMLQAQQGASENKLAAMTPAALSHQVVVKTAARRRVMRMREVEQTTGKKKSSIYAAIKAGTFPAPISLGSRARGWMSTDIDAWLDQRKAESQGG